MTNPLIDPYIVLNKVYSGGKYLKQAIAESGIEPANKNRTVAVCYGVLERDIYLNYIISANTQKSPKSAVRLILKIALYVLEYLSIKDYTVVDNAVELTKKLGKGGAAGFVNAFLRSYKIPPLPAQADMRLSVGASVPLWLAKLVRRAYKDEADAILRTPSEGVCVRFERRADEYLSRCNDGRNPPPLRTPFEGVYIFRKFVRDDGFFTGDYTFQSVGSIAICTAISGGERLLDMCAAPGGKSVLLSKKFTSVTACELHPHRVGLIESYCARMGVDNVRAVCADGTVFNAAYSNAFDAVLVDAPCSGTGVINENPDIKLNRKEEDIPSLMATQSALLNNAARYVKAGGMLYYSTCSILPQENDTAAYNFLSEHADFELAVPSSPLNHKRTRFGLQFLPHISMGAGFYLTAFKRRDASAAPQQTL